MANPRPGKGRKFQKGQVANPKGAGAHNKDLKAIRRLTQQEIADVGGMILNSNLEQLKVTRADPTSSVFKVWVCSVAIMAINKGDAHAMGVLLDRIVGKVRDHVELTVGDSVAARREMVWQTSAFDQAKPVESTAVVPAIETTAAPVVVLDAYDRPKNKTG